MRRYLYCVIVCAAAFTSACGGGGGGSGGGSGGSGGGGSSSGSTPSPTITPIVTPASTVTSSPMATLTPVQTAVPSSTVSPIISPTVAPSSVVTISGALTYDFVPHSSFGAALNYDNISVKPIRGASIRVLSSSNQVLGQTTSDASGLYSVTVAQNLNVSIRVLAELSRSGSPSWDFAVTDNTNGNAQYVLQGSLVNSGTDNTIRDLHAASGWGGAGYTTTRAAAPFAILDSVYEGLQQVLIADPTVALPPAELRWSILNQAVGGSRADGNIGTSFYDPSEDNMYILGDENNDTDEYDKSVIQHEWGHYLEDTLSRSDSIGGSHSLSGSFDMRLVLSEGFANAFSAIASEQQFYADSGGTLQSRGFRFSLEANSFGNAGWFSENSIGKIIYDIADDNNDGVDTLSAGFTPIYNAMTSSDYSQSTAMISIYLLIAEIKEFSSSEVDDVLDALMLEEGLTGSGVYGDGETNDSAANRSFILPVYNSLSIGGTVNVCGNNLEGLNEGNGMDARRFIRVNIPSAGSYFISASTTLGTGAKDPDIEVFRRGSRFKVLDSGVSDSESGSVNFTDIGEYILEVYDFLNIDGETGGGSACFDVSISAA